MQIDIDWKDCIRDSPKFRSTLLDHEKDIESFETLIEKLMKQCDNIIDAGKAHYNANNSFLNNVQLLMVHFKDDMMMLEAIGKFTQCLSQWNQSYNSIIDQCSSYFIQCMNNFIKNDMKRVKDSRRNFSKMSEDIETAFSRNAQVSRSKVNECQEAASNLVIARNNFKKASIDYVFEVNIIQYKKRTEVLNCLISYLGGHQSFASQANSNFNDLSPYLQKLSNNLHTLQTNAASTRQQLRNESNAVLNLALNGTLEDHHSVNNGVQMEDNLGDDCMEGYLYKRTSNAFKSWVRRWFIVENNQLLYCSQHKSRDGAVVLEKDLRLCNVVPFQDTDRRFCFQILSPLRSHLLQADNELDCHKWVSFIQESARKAYSKMTNNPPIVAYSKSSSSNDLRSSSCSPMRCQSISSPPSSSSNNTTTTTSLLKVPSHVKSILSIAGNETCCDCGHPDPRWASFNLGITLCIECSGIHRSFGVHKSKVRSVTLDAWDVDQVKVMQQLGNNVVKRIFECGYDSSSGGAGGGGSSGGAGGSSGGGGSGGGSVKRATPSSSRSEREAWITAKYLKRSFVRSRRDNDTNDDDDDVNIVTSQPATAHNVSSIIVKDECNDLRDQQQDLDEDENNISFRKELTTSFQSDVDDTNNNVDYWLKREASSSQAANQMLCEAAEAGSLPGMLKALALGADANFRNVQDFGRTPLIYSLSSGENVPVEFMLLNGAKVDIVDEDKRSPLHHAAILGNTGQICLLLKRKANQHFKDVEGDDPLSIAIKKADANVVTILRLARLNEEMKGTDCGFDNPSDDMFAEVFKDFSAIPGNSHNSSNNYDSSTLQSNSSTCTINSAFTQ